MDQLDLSDIKKKQRHYFANKRLSSKSYGFSSIHVWMWELDYKESWTPKNWCFWTVVLEKTLESPLDCKEIQPVLKEVSPEYSLEGLMLKLKLQYYGYLMQRTDSLERPWCWERVKAGGDRGWDGWMASPAQWTWVWVDSRSWWWTGRPGVLRFMGSKRVEHDWATGLNWGCKSFSCLANSNPRAPFRFYQTFFQKGHPEPPLQRSGVSAHPAITCSTTSAVFCATHIISAVTPL